MKKIQIVLFALACLLATAKSLVAANGELNVYFSYNVFNIPGGTPYLETYLTINGKSVNYKQLNNGKFQGTVEVSLGLFQRDSVYAPRKYNLLSPEVADTIEKPSFIDQQRISLKPGMYALEINISDPNSAGKKKYTISERIDVNFSPGVISMSDIELLEKFSKSTAPTALTKSGYDLVPYPVGTYPDEMTRLAFYCEAYDLTSLLAANERFLFMYYIEYAETKEKVEGFAGFEKQNAASVNVLLAQMEISKLKNGAYNLVVEIRDQVNKLVLQKKVYFNRKSKAERSEMADVNSVVIDSTFVLAINNKDSMVDYIRSLWPISSVSERQYAQNQLAKKDLVSMQKFFYAFWKDHNTKDPESEWKKYHEQVLIVNRIFSAGKIKGYATDRGRVYLQYGTPDSRQEYMSESNAYPYEVWQYYRLVDPGTGMIQTNKRFVFMNNELAGNNYKLIHSEARGEMYDARWKLRLLKRTVQGSDLDFENPGSTWGNNIDDNFAAPK